MIEPHASRPYMPGYGTKGPNAGGGLLPWSWAEERLTAAKYFWVSTSWPDGRPHVMPVWGVWDRGTVLFSSGGRSRKTRNLAADPRCVVTTDNAVEPVVVEGRASILTDRDSIERFIEVANAKYGQTYSVEFLDPAVNATIRVQPERVIGLDEANFDGSPTRWTFAGGQDGAPAAAGHPQEG